jgi:hypothetical protein
MDRKAGPLRTQHFTHSPSFRRHRQPLDTGRAAQNMFYHGPPMSKVPCQTGVMKIQKSVSFWSVPDETIAKFGPVHLVRKADGRHVLIGGTPCEQAEARRWCHRRAPFVTFTAPRRQNRRPVKRHLRENRPRRMIRFIARQPLAPMETIHSRGGTGSF